MKTCAAFPSVQPCDIAGNTPASAQPNGFGILKNQHAMCVDGERVCSVGEPVDVTNLLAQVLG